MAKTAEPRPVVEEQAAEKAAPECCLKPVHTLEEPAPDPFAGHGGTYELDLLTGERHPAPKTEEV